MTRLLSFLRRRPDPELQRQADELRYRQEALSKKLRVLTWQHKPRAHVERDLRAVTLERLRRGV